MFYELAAAAGLVFPSGVVEALDAAWDAGVNAYLLEGEPGTGKTHLARALGAWTTAQGGRFIHAQANAWASDETTIRGVDLAGFVERDPSRVYAAGVLLRAAQASTETPQPVVVLLDEWDKTRPVADGLLLAALEERLVVDAAGQIHGRLGANVIFWITSNAERRLSDALQRRCLRIALPRMAAEDAQALLRYRTGCGEALAAALVGLRDRCQTLVTLPDMIRLASVIQRCNSIDAVRVLTASALRDDPPATRRFDPGADLWAAHRRDLAEGWQPAPAGTMLAAFATAMGAAE